MYTSGTKLVYQAETTTLALLPMLPYQSLRASHTIVFSCPSSATGSPAMKSAPRCEMSPRTVLTCCIPIETPFVSTSIVTQAGSPWLASA